MSTETKEQDSRTELLADLGLAIKSSTPMGDVRDNWPSIKYTTQLFRKDRLVWEGEYRLGIGHVKIPALGLIDFHAVRFSQEQHAMLLSMRNRPGANFVNKELQASACAALARVQKVSPKLADVLHSLLSDSDAYLQHESFEDWATGSGYDQDSIKARGVYDTCIETGRKLSRAFSAAEIEELRKAFQDY